MYSTFKPASLAKRGSIPGGIGLSVIPIGGAGICGLPHIS